MNIAWEMETEMKMKILDSLHDGLARDVVKQHLLDFHVSSYHEGVMAVLEWMGKHLEYHRGEGTREVIDGFGSNGCCGRTFI